MIFVLEFISGSSSLRSFISFDSNSIPTLLIDPMFESVAIPFSSLAMAE